MKHPYGDALLRLPLQARLALIDDLLAAEMASPKERRVLLMDHTLLAGVAEFVLRFDRLEHDQDGFAFLPLPAGGRAYEVDDFLAYLRRDPRRLQGLADCISDALFLRFLQDVAAAV